MAKKRSTVESKMRKDVMTKDDYYMGIAVLSSFRSKDPVTQVGACIVNKEDRIVGIGYNGMPNRTKDKEMPWGKDEENKMNDKHLYVCHAEMNAIANKYAADLRNCRMYVNHFPCNECAKIIVQAGIRKVIYDKPLPKEKAKKPEYKATKKIFKITNIKHRLHRPKQGIRLFKEKKPSVQKTKIHQSKCKGVKKGKK